MNKCSMAVNLMLGNNSPQRADVDFIFSQSDIALFWNRVLHHALIISGHKPVVLGYQTDPHPA